MSKWIFAAAATAIVSACGVDGEPETPETTEAAAPPPVVEPTVSPAVRITPRGVRASTGLGVKIGAVKVGLGL